MKYSCIALKSALVVLALVGAATLALAAVPGTITYQGRLTNSSGTNVPDGNYLIRFVIYNAASGGTVLWDNDYRTVTVTGGLFTYNLGDSVALPNTLFASDTTRISASRLAPIPNSSPGQTEHCAVFL